ncbi:MAG: sulfatase-like hydrolase/transferase [Candidatus Eisenbacteria sp.]|nr:sulfatase-like hydrolase/transferase [Candidatus Eisenbacteria bacterium]
MQRRFWLGLLGLAILLAVILILIARKPREVEPTSVAKQPDIVLVTVDALRRDHVGAYGSDLGATPRLDEMAQEAVLFEDAVTPVPLTGAGLASIITARLPLQHRLRQDVQGNLPQTETTVAEALSLAGYQTAAFFSSDLCIIGLEQGFNVLSLPEGPERPSQETVQAALSWLETHTEAPLFLWVHISEPRGPWRASFPWNLRYLEAPYAGEVAAADEAIGSLFDGIDRLGRLNGAHLVIMAPTGEAMEEEGELEHGVLLGEATLRVPWIWRLPSQDPGAGRMMHRIQGLAATTDFFPTLFDVLGLDLPPGTPPQEGQSLSACLLEEEPSPRQSLLLETLLPQQAYGWAPLLGLRTAEWKLVVAPEARLYNLQRHPMQPYLPSPQTTEMTAKLMEALDTELRRQATEESESETWQEWAKGKQDPYQRVTLSTALIKASRALQLGEPAEARRAGGDLAERFPDNPRVKLLDAFIHLASGEYESAQEGFRAVLDQLGAACEARLGLAECLLKQNLPHEASSALMMDSSDLLDTCLWLLPMDPEVPFRMWFTKGLADARARNLPMAAHAFKQAAHKAPRTALAHKAGKLNENARFLRDMAERNGPLHPSERPLVVQSALELDAPDVARRLLARRPKGKPRKPDEKPDPRLSLLDAREALQSGNVQRARSLTEKTLDQGVARLEDCIAVADHLNRSGHRREAIGLLERAVPSFGKSPELHFHLARLLATNRHKEQALIHLETALRLGFRDWDGLLSRPLRGLCKSKRISKYWREPSAS